MFRPAWAHDETLRPARPPAWRCAPRLSPTVRGTIKTATGSPTTTPVFSNPQARKRAQKFSLVLNVKRRAPLAVVIRPKVFELMFTTGFPKFG